MLAANTRFLKRGHIQYRVLKALFVQHEGNGGERARTQERVRRDGGELRFAGPRRPAGRG